VESGDETIDTFDDLGRHMGTKPRAAVHRDGDWHQVFNCLVVRLARKEPAVLLQLRGTGSGAFPNLLDLTAGGHLLAGEPPLMGGVREFQEELGVEVAPDDLVFLGVRRNVLVDSEGMVHRELIHAFLVLDDRPLEAYRLQPGEVAGLFECSITALLAALDAPSKPVQGNGVVIRANGTMGSSRRSFTAADLVPNDPYWITILVMADRLALGRHPLAV
jgi:8-oxo-dGTP pyrophosphatase MutT (NUDIX family)